MLTIWKIMQPKSKACSSWTFLRCITVKKWMKLHQVILVGSVSLDRIEQSHLSSCWKVENLTFFWYVYVNIINEWIKLINDILVILKSIFANIFTSIFIIWILYFSILNGDRLFIELVYIYNGWFLLALKTMSNIYLRLDIRFK